MEYFKKAVKSVKDIQKAVSAFAESAGLTPTTSFKTPAEQFVYCFREACSIIDELSERDDADTSAADNDLFESKVRTYFKIMISLLVKESDKWSEEFNDSVDDEISEMPCFDVFLYDRVCEELVKRAIKDKPRGMLPLILGTLASLIRSIKYPLLPISNNSKHISRLISFASRFDALHYTASYSSSSSTTSKALPSSAVDHKSEILNYKKRVDSGLTGKCVYIYTVYSNVHAVQCIIQTNKSTHYTTH